VKVNAIDFILLCLSSGQIGVVPALINFNLRLQPLKHSVEVAKSKALIYGHELTDGKDLLRKCVRKRSGVISLNSFSFPAVTEILDMGGMETLPLYCSGHAGSNFLMKATDLDAGLLHAPTSVPVPSEAINFTDKLLYIFTSGTTGLPKAAVIKHSRYELCRIIPWDQQMIPGMIWFEFCVYSRWRWRWQYFTFFCLLFVRMDNSYIMATMGSHVMSNILGSDVLYAPFPLYHTVGIALGVGQGLLCGCTVVLRRKFSATNFWRDCIQYKVTVGHSATSTQSKPFPYNFFFPNLQCFSPPLLQNFF